MNRRRVLAGAMASPFFFAHWLRDGHARAEGAPPARRPLGRFSTTFATDAEHRTRALNVELAASAIDGKAIFPGETMSFNDTVGERTAAFGFAKAVVLKDGMIAEGVGGGACQVASTLHAAALLAGLDVVSRAPHSRPSAYIRMGLDATVVFGKVDLKIKNPRAAKVVVHARAVRGNLEIWIEGEGPAPGVTLVSEIVDRVRFERVVEKIAKDDGSLDLDTVRVKAFGLPGFRVERTRVVRMPDGATRRDVRVDEYPPTSEILLVLPTFDTARLAHDGDVDEDGDPILVPKGAPPLKRDVRGALAPTPVQIRPSLRVVLDNS